jgi:hypothetical protein
MKALSILLVVLLSVQITGCALAGSNPSPGRAKTTPALELNVDITEGSVEAQVTESNPGTAVFHGTVTVQMPSLRGAQVTLASSTDIGWVSSISPSSFTLDNGQTGSFTVTVIVPQGTPSTQAGNIVVNGRAVANGLQAMDDAQALITVKTYFRVTLDAARPKVETAPGGSARFSLRLTNAGNGIDSFALRLANQDELRKQGWFLSISITSSGKIAPGEFRTVTIIMTAPASFSPYVNRETTLYIKARSEGARQANQTAELDFPLVARETGVSATGSGAVGLVIAVIAVGAFVLIRRRRRSTLTDA